MALFRAKFRIEEGADHVAKFTSGYSTLFVSATSLVTQLARAHAEGRLEEKLIHFTKDALDRLDVEMPSFHAALEKTAAERFPRQS